MSDSATTCDKRLGARTGTSPHFSAFAPESPGTLLLPLLSHAAGRRVRSAKHARDRATQHTIYAHF